ncbi:MAG: hypothetical protein M3065_05540 [Actinomycetota bacterium]|nr:hypothetical protein [Actinomycetota bacterium]
MTKCLFSRRSLSLSATLAVLLIGVTAGPALAKDPTGGTIDASMCSDPVLSQPFASLGDMNWYALAPGQTPDNFDGAGWTLNNGANIATAQLADGQTGSVLDLPAGSQAVSPPICVAANYPIARMMVQSTDGAKVAFAVSYAGTNSTDKPQNAGRIQGQDEGSSSGWSASNPLNLHPGKPLGWQIVRLYFTSRGDQGDAQIYNFYIDPRMKS